MLSFFGGNKEKKDSNQEISDLYKQILNYCRYHLRNDEAAKDCTQDIFSLYFEKTAQCQIHNPKAWLYRTADNFLHRYNRNLQKEEQKNAPLPETDIAEDRRFAYDQNFDLFSEENVDIEKDMEMIFSELSQEEHTLWNQYFKEQLQIKKLAELYQVSVPAMKARIHRLKQHILKCVNEIYENRDSKRLQ